MIKKLSRRLATLLPALALVLAIGSPFTSIAHADTTVPITGVITGPGGERLGANVFITATSLTTGATYPAENNKTTDYSSRNLHEDGYEVYTYDVPEPGAYTLDVPPDTYDIHFTARPQDSTIPWEATTVSNVSVNGPTTVNAQLTLSVATHTLSGTYTDSAGNPIPDAWIQAWDAGPSVEVKTDSSGHYSMALYPGYWNITGFSYNNTAPNLPQQFNYTDGIQARLDSDEIKNLQTPETTTLTVHTTDINGNADPGQYVNIGDQYGPTDSLNQPRMGESNAVQSDASGTATMVVWKNLGAPVCAVFVDNKVIRTCTHDQTPILGPTTITLSEADGILMRPFIEPVTYTPSPIYTNQNITFNTSYTTPPYQYGVYDMIWDWGDGTPNTTVSIPQATNAATSTSHTYAMPGTYTLKTTVANEWIPKFTSTITQQITVLSSSQTASFKDSGKFDSPAGAIVASPQTTGKATLGVDAKYTNGALNASASLDIKKTNVSFNSTSCQSLSVTIPNARLSCTGTMNGVSGYHMLVVGFDDGHKGKVRIKITDANNVVVYDTQLGDPDTATPITALTSGNMSLHN